ncbi:hypothetical protein [Vibrio sp.]|uniref:hypothetical protein n=1 Tax=Vibrio sp. TaxID=678 RepID=UPI003D0BB731
MAQAIHVESIATPTSMDKRTYAVNIKGLIAHLLDILFVDNTPSETYYANELSSHMQKDLGIGR